MAEVAGLVLGAVGVLGIFSTCIECFDIVDAGRNHSNELEQLSALVSWLGSCCCHMLTVTSSWLWNDLDSAFGDRQSASHLAMTAQALRTIRYSIGQISGQWWSRLCTI
jgi:hypothetical protein